MYQNNGQFDRIPLCLMEIFESILSNAYTAFITLSFITEMKSTVDLFSKFIND